MIKQSNCGRILVVGLNPAADKTITVDTFAEGGTNIVLESQITPGGKAVNVSAALKELGMEPLLTGFIAGATGEYIERAAAEKSIITDFVRISGETRTNYKVFSRQTKQITELNETGPDISESDLEAFLKKFYILLDEGCDMLILSGSLPPGAPEDTYMPMLIKASEKNIPAILDTNSRILKKSISGKPAAVKPNRNELEEFFGRTLENEKEIASALNEVLKQGAGLAVVSLGRSGAAASDGIKTYHASSYEIEPMNTVGAGDAMVAALAMCIFERMPLPETLSFITAYATESTALPAGVYACKNRAIDAVNRVKIKEIK